MRLLLLLWARRAAALQPLKPRYIVVFRDTQAAFRSEDFRCVQRLPGSAAAGDAAGAACGVVESVSCANDAAALALARRSVLVKYVIEEYGRGPNLEAAAALECAPASLECLAADAERSWRVASLHVGASHGRSKLRCNFDADELRLLSPHTNTLAGEVNLKNATDTLAIIYQYGSSDRSSLETCWFGRLVATGDGGDLLTKYKLTDRPYIGSTTMDAELALIMARAARVEAGSLVLDPFAGTGGVLLATTHFSKTQGWAADVDARVLLAGTPHCDDGAVSLKDQVLVDAVLAKKRKKRKPSAPRDVDAGIAANFDAARLPRPRLVVADVRRLDDALDDEKAYFDDEGDVERGVIFDAIVTDPPYGVRERIASADETGRADWLGALYDVALKRLKPGGRLVFWLPSSQEAAPRINAAFVDAPAPLRWVSCATQDLAGGWARTLVVLERDEAGLPSAAASSTTSAAAGVYLEMADKWRAAGAKAGGSANVD
ncbi:hypothetical protein M885DRAFT_504549 [Pelagophyceae sp. CCMP2097]|nr:hypothetical protein M885DRAFT_504549 [Pelagophyceae sp. CCMP2097]